MDFFVNISFLGDQKYRGRGVLRSIREAGECVWCVVEVIGDYFGIQRSEIVYKVKKVHQKIAWNWRILKSKIWASDFQNGITWRVVVDPKMFISDINETLVRLYFAAIEFDAIGAQNCDFCRDINSHSCGVRKKIRIDCKKIIFELIFLQNRIKSFDRESDRYSQIVVR